MELTSIIFPAPESSYSYESAKDDLVFIPRAKIIKGVSQFSISHEYRKEPHHIPCWYIKSPKSSSKVILYFHGNAEDAGISKDLLEYMSEFLNTHVICVEYPGYGIYPGRPEASRIVQDCINVFDYIAHECQWGEQNIIILGQSIGCGPAIQVAAVKMPAAVVLVSPFTSIKGVVHSLVGKVFKVFVKERFKNLEIIKWVKSPLFMLHGKADKLIPYAHSLELQKNYKGKRCELRTPEKMGHNEFDPMMDLTLPLKKFLESEGITMEVSEGAKREIGFPKSVLEKPPNFPAAKSSGAISKLLRKFF